MPHGELSVNQAGTLRDDAPAGRRPTPARGLEGVGASTMASMFDGFIKAPAASDTGINGQILIIVNPADLGDLLAFCLTAAGFRVRTSADARDGVREIERFSPDVVLLDCKAPDFEGTVTWRQLRAARVSRGAQGTRAAQPIGDRQPAVVMFIRDEHDIDPRLGLEFGPCDFVLYPFGVRDLVLRVDGIIRARHALLASASAPRRSYLIGPLELDVDKHTALVEGVAVHLSALEMRLLADLIEHRGHVRSRAALLTEVCGYHAGVTTRAADVHVTRLRGKLGAAAGLVETIRGTGYRLSSKFPIVVKA